jgi:hypothetical protein
MLIISGYVYVEPADTLAFIRRWQSRMKGEVLKYDAFNERGLMEG